MSVVSTYKETKHDSNHTKRFLVAVKVTAKYYYNVSHKQTNFLIVFFSTYLLILPVTDSGEKPYFTFYLMYFRLYQIDRLLSLRTRNELPNDNLDHTTTIYLEQAVI